MLRIFYLVIIGKLFNFDRNGRCSWRCGRKDVVLINPPALGAALDPGLAELMMFL